MGLFTTRTDDLLEDVLIELRALHGENAAIMRRLHNMEVTMDNNARVLMAAISAADSKLDGYAAIITASSQAIRDAQAALLSLKDEPTPAEVQQVVTDLGTHLTNVDTAVAALNVSPVPAAPADGSVPQPSPAAPAPSSEAPAA